MVKKIAFFGKRYRKNITFRVAQNRGASNEKIHMDVDIVHSDMKGWAEERRGMHIPILLT